MNTESYATVKEIWVKGPVPEPARGSSLRAEDYLFPPGGRISEPRIGREEYAPSLKTFANADRTRLAFDVAVPTSLSPTYVQNGVLCMPGAGTLGMALVEAVKRIAESHSR